MAFQLRRPILVGGLSLTAGAWVLNGLHGAVSDLSGTLVLGAIALGSGMWWWSHQTREIDGFTTLKITPPTDRTAVEKTLSDVETWITHLTQEAELLGATGTLEPFVTSVRERVTQLSRELDRTQIRLAVMGGKSAGKTTLAQQVASHFAAPALGAPESATALSVATQPMLETSEGQTADLVLFVITGDLTDSEFQTLQDVLNRPQRVVVVFNKQDQYLPADRPVILQQLRERLRDYVQLEDVVAIAAQPAPIKIRQHQADGSFQERIEQPAPDLNALLSRVQEMLTTQARSLVWTTVQRKTLALQQEIRTQLHHLKRERALPIIEQSQWIAAATAFANPIPSLDLLATAAINTQLILDLGTIYQQSFSLQQAKTIAGTMASVMVKLGLVEMTSQAIAPLLKSHALTYAAGGAIQGISAAYLTRLAGLSLVEYFQEQNQLPGTSGEFSFSIDRFTQTLKAVFQINQRGAGLQTFVQQGLKHLIPDTASAISPSS